MQSKIAKTPPHHILKILQEATANRQAIKLFKSFGWSGIYSPHATRTTRSTRLNEMGYRPDAIEAQLTHADTNNVRRTYNHAAYLDERKIMMLEWADKLDKWIAGFE